MHRERLLVLRECLRVLRDRLLELRNPGAHVLESLVHAIETAVAHGSDERRREGRGKRENDTHRRSDPRDIPRNDDDASRRS